MKKLNLLAMSKIALLVTCAYQPTFADTTNNNIELVENSRLESSVQAIYGQSWKAHFAKDHAEIVQAMPDPQAVASKVVKDQLVKHGYAWIDPDKTYYNVFAGSVNSPRTYNGWQHFTQPVGSYTLTQAVMLNVFNQFRDSGPGTIDLYTGVYKQGMGAKRYYEKNEERLLSSKLWDIAYYNIDVQAAYTKALKEFWKIHGEKYTHLMRDSFAFSAYQQYQQGLLSQAQYQLANTVIKNHRSSDIHVYRFDIYGYYSTDILLIEQNGHQAGLMYIPGAAQPFIPYHSERQLKKIIHKAIQSKKTRQAMARHFSLYDRQDGKSYSGVNSALKGLATGTWKESYLMMKKNTINGDIFARLTEIKKARMASDGDTVIKSNSEAERDYILSTTYSVFNVFPVIDVILPELGIPLTLAMGATQLGLSIDKSINGDTLAERIEGTKMTAVNATLVAATAVIPVAAKFGRRVTTSLEATTATNSIHSGIAMAEGVSEAEIASFTNTPKIVVHPQTGEELLGVRLTDTPKSTLLKADGFGMYKEVDPVSGRILSNSRVMRAIDQETGDVQWLSQGGLRGGAESTAGSDVASSEAASSDVTESQLPATPDRSEILLPEDLPKRPGLGGSGYAQMGGRLDDVTRDFFELEMRVDPYAKLNDVKALHRLNTQALEEAKTVPFYRQYQPELKGITVFRGDERLPDEIFHSGFNRRITPVQYITLAEHTKAIRGVVSTSTSESVAVSYAIHNQRGYVYAIELSDGGVAVDTSLRGATLHEIATLNVPPEDIMFAVGPFNNTEVDLAIIKESPDARTAELLINPHAKASAEVAEAAFEKMKATLKYQLSPEMSFAERYNNRHDLFWHEEEITSYSVSESN